MICCVTGHRKVPKDKINYVNEALRKEIEAAIKEGYTTFISGFEDGVDLMFSNIVSEIKQENNSIKLIAAIPYRNRLNASNKLFRQLIGRCDHVEVIAEKYFSNFFLLRSGWMVMQSAKVIAVYNGCGKTRTASTMRYASVLGRNIDVINI